MKKLFAAGIAAAMLLTMSTIASAAMVSVDMEELIYPIGDVDCNEVVDAVDLTELRLCLLQQKTPVNIRTANVNMDDENKIDLLDLIRLKKMLAQ